MAQPRLKSDRDPVLRSINRMRQALELECAEAQQVTISTVLVETKEEAEALRRFLLAHRRDPVDGIERFRFKERALWRHVKNVLARAPEYAESEEED